MPEILFTLGDYKDRERIVSIMRGRVINKVSSHAGEVKIELLGDIKITFKCDEVMYGEVEIKNE